MNTQCFQVSPGRLCCLWLFPNLSPTICLWLVFRILCSCGGTQQHTNMTEDLVWCGKLLTCAVLPSSQIFYSCLPKLHLPLFRRWKRKYETKRERVLTQPFALMPNFSDSLWIGAGSWHTLDPLAIQSDPRLCCLLQFTGTVSHVGEGPVVAYHSTCLQWWVYVSVG